MHGRRNKGHRRHQGKVLLGVGAGDDSHRGKVIGVILHRCRHHEGAFVQVHLIITGCIGLSPGTILGCHGRAFQGKAVVRVGHIAEQHAAWGQLHIQRGQQVGHHHRVGHIGGVHRVLEGHHVIPFGDDRKGIVTSCIRGLYPGPAAAPVCSHGHILDLGSRHSIGHGAIQLSNARALRQRHLHCRQGIDRAHAPVVVRAVGVVTATV